MPNSVVPTIIWPTGARAPGGGHAPLRAPPRRTARRDRPRGRQAQRRRHAAARERRRQPGAVQRRQGRLPEAGRDARERETHRSGGYVGRRRLDRQRERQRRAEAEEPRRPRKARRIEGGPAPARVCRVGRAPRRRLCASTDHSAGPGQFLGRRQDRDQLHAWQEPDRRVLSAGAGGGRHRAARYVAGARVPRGLCRGGEIRPAWRCGVL